MSQNVNFTRERIELIDSIRYSDCCWQIAVCARQSFVWAYNNKKKEKKKIISKAPNFSSYGTREKEIMFFDTSHLKYPERRYKKAE